MNVLDLIEKVIGKTLTPETLVYLRSAPNAIYAELQLAHREWEKNYILPDLQPGEIRPYIPLERADWRISGISLPYFSRQTGIEGIQGSEIATDALIQHLLLCHSLAIDCPLSYLLDHFGLVPNPSSAPRLKIQITDFLHFACTIRPLLNKGIVHFVESWPEKMGPQKYNIFSQEDISAAAANTDWSDMSDIFDHTSESFTVQTKEAFLYSSVANNIELTMSKSAVLGGNYTMYLPKKCYQALFLEFVKRTEREIRKLTSHDDDKLALADLINIDMPRLKSISIQDLVSIRSNEDIFEDWRKILRKGLTDAGTVRIEDVLAGDARVRGMKHVMDDARRELNSKIGNASSRIKIDARQATKGFLIKALGMSALAPDLIKEAIIAGGVHSGLEYIWSHLTAHKLPSAAEQSLQRHIMAAS